MLRNTLFLVGILSTALFTVFGIAYSPPQREALGLELGLKLQRETKSGNYKLLAADLPCRKNDTLQLLFKANRNAFVMIASANGTTSAAELELLYPVPGQTGNVRPAWTYALPSPEQSYTLDGHTMQIVVVVSNGHLPKSREGRINMLQAARRNPTPFKASLKVPIRLRDGSPASLQMMQAKADDLLAVVVDVNCSG